MPDRDGKVLRDVIDVRFAKGEARKKSAYGLVLFAWFRLTHLLFPENVMLDEAILYRRRLLQRLPIWVFQACFIPILLLLFVLRIQVAHSAAAIEDSKTQVDCAEIQASPGSTYSFQVNGRKLHLAVMERFVNQERLMTIYLEQDNTCWSLVSNPGGYAAYYYPVKDTYPGMAIYGTKDAFGHFVQYFRWTGRTYERIDLTESYKMNTAAQELFNKGRSDDAIALWEQAAELTKIPGLDVSANPDVLYNLGYAYYRKGKKYYDQAATYLIAGIKKDSASDGGRRYAANRTLGDIYSESNRLEDAIQRYKWGVDFSLPSESRSKIINNILHLRQREGRNGTLPKGTIDEPIEDFVADAQLLSADDDYGHLVRVVADFNNDGLKDMAVNTWPFGTAVPQWHLYVQDKNGKYLRVEDIEFHPLDISIEPAGKNSAKIIVTSYGSSQDQGTISEYIMFGRDMVSSGATHDKKENEKLFQKSRNNPISEYCVVNAYFSKNCHWTKGY